MEEAHVQADDVVKGIAWRIDSYLEEHEKSVELLARLDDIQNVFLSKNPRALEIANFALDKFYDALDIEVCYLMDSGGTVIASSNRSAADSIVGQNYSIRRYFLDAVQGVPSIYMAVGIISKKPGIYYSYPVYGHDGKTPAGVAVIRSSVKHIEEIINVQFDGAMSVVDPNGVVFISNRKDWLYGTLWRLPDEKMSEITKILQLGDEQLEWTEATSKPSKQWLS